MREFWAVVGQILVNKTFYEKVFSLCIYGSKFEDLDKLRYFLAKDLGLGFSRWEVMRINSIITERVIGNRFVRVDLANEEDSIRVVQGGWDETPPDLRANFDLCSVIGLTSMDINFRHELHNASDEPEDKTSKLKKVLEETTGNTPIFKLQPLELVSLKKFLRSLTDSLMEAMKIFHYTNWVQPDKYPCDGGVTKTVFTITVDGATKTVTVPYEHFYQNGLNLLLERQSEKPRGDLRGARAIL